MSAFSSRFFWVDSTERAIKTIAQTAGALLAAGGFLNLLAVNWGDVASVSGLAGVISVLTSIASAGSGNSASLVVDAKLKN